MAAFAYRAVAGDGSIRTGRISADSEERAAARLRQRGLTPVGLTR